MHIIGLKAQNWMRIEAVNIKPTGKGVFTIGGENDQGKSAVLKMVRAILGGKHELPAVPVRRGETKALGELTIGDDQKVIVASLTLTAEGGYQLKVRSKDGAAYAKPATLLAELVSAISFDPLAVLDMPPKDQRALFFKLAGLNFDALDGKRQRIADERTAVGRDVAGRKRAIDEMPHHADVPAEEVSVSVLAKKLEAAQAHNRERSAFSQAAGTSEEDVRTSAVEIKHALGQIAKWEAVLKTETAVKDEARRVANDLRAKYEACAEIDCAPIHTAIDTAEDTNRKVRANVARALVQTQFDEDHDRYIHMTEEIDGIDAEKRQMLSGAKFPVEGLTFPETGGVLYRGLPLDQDSGSGQIIRAVEVAAALNPTLRMLLVDNSERLGLARLRELHEWAEANDFQVLMARVSTGSECAVIIQDGRVKGAEAEQVEEPEKAEVQA